MADLKKTALDLNGGVVTDAEIVDIGQYDTENLMKRPGGSPRGLRVRPGVEHFDTILAGEISKVSTGVVPVRCKLDASDGYPGGSYITALVRVEDRSILEMHFGIAQRSEAAPDEEDSPSNLIPVAVSNSDAGESGANVGCIVAWDTVQNDFVYFYISCSEATSPKTNLHFGPNGRLLHHYEKESTTTDVQAVYNWSLGVGGGGAMNGVTPPPTLASLTKIPNAARVDIDKVPYSLLNGWSWVSRSGVFYTLVFDGPNPGMDGFYFSRMNAFTGVSMGLKGISFPVISGSSEATPIRISRPDVNGDVVIFYETDNSKVGMVKVNPATGAILANRDVTGSVSGPVSVVPMSTGKFFVHSGNKLYVLPSDLSSITEILSGRASAEYPNILTNCGGLGDTVYLETSYTSPTLAKITNVSTTPVLTVYAPALPESPDIFYSVTFPGEDGDLESHFRIDSNTMMYGMWSKIDLSTGATIEILAVEDRLSLHDYDDLVPGGASFADSQVDMFMDPMRVLMAEEGYRELPS